MRARQQEQGVDDSAHEQGCDRNDSQGRKAISGRGGGRDPTVRAEALQAIEHQSKGDQGAEPQAGRYQVKSIRGQMNHSLAAQAFAAMSGKGERSEIGGYEQAGRDPEVSGNAALACPASPE